MLQKLNALSIAITAVAFFILSGVCAVPDSRTLTPAYLPSVAVFLGEVLKLMGAVAPEHVAPGLAREHVSPRVADRAHHRLLPRRCRRAVAGRAADGRAGDDGAAEQGGDVSGGSRRAAARPLRVAGTGVAARDAARGRCRLTKNIPTVNVTYTRRRTGQPPALT